MSCPITKRDLLADPESCFNKAADDEPLFILRGQDLSAPDVIRYWLNCNLIAGLDKRRAATQVQNAMLDWKPRKRAD